MALLATTELIRRLAAHRPVTAEVARVNAAVTELSAYLAANGVFTAVEELDGRLVLYAATSTAKQQEVLLNAHLDMVPAEEATYTVREDNGWLLGRGTHDCLGNAALIANLLIRLNGKARIGAIFSTDEEIGGWTTRFMVKHGYTAGKLVLVLDGPGYAVAVAQKGILCVRLKAHGQACHAAEPWKGTNAIDLLLAGYGKLRERFPPVQAGDEWHDTMAATIIQAGTVSNRIPDTAEMILNIRFTHAADDVRLAEEIRTVSGLEVNATTDCQPLLFSPEQPVLRRLVSFLAKQLGRDIAIQRMNGATDARHFAALGVPVAMIGVPGRDAHGAGEGLDLAGLAAYELVLEAFLAERRWAR